MLIVPKITYGKPMVAEHLYKVELRYRRPDCCVKNRFYWVATSTRVTAETPEQARQRAWDLFQANGKTEILKVTELFNENQD